MTLAAVSGPTSEPVGSIIRLPAPADYITASPRVVKRPASHEPVAQSLALDKATATSMNLTLLAAVASLMLWIIFGFVAAVPSGWVHLFYAAGVVLLARRVIAGAPKFRS